MAILIDLATKKRFSLRPHHIFGRRKARVDTYLEGKEKSLMHASVRWEDQKWMLMDHSKNGTWLDGMRLTPGESVELKQGSRISFSSSGDSTWQVDDLGEPSAVLIPVDNAESAMELSDFHVLPDETNPLISIYQSAMGQWVCEEQERTYVLEDGAIINTGSSLLQFFNSSDVNVTLDRIGQKIIAVEDILFTFFVSLDEEHIRLTINCKGLELDLGERVHHYLLLLLARQRLKHSNEGLDLNSQGWIDMDQLCSMLRMGQTHINIQIYRARNQVIASLKNLMHTPQVVERRAGSLRFGFPRFQIIRGSDLEGEVIAKKKTEHQET